MYKVKSQPYYDSSCFYQNSYFSNEVESRFNIISSKNKIELIQTKQALEEELLEKRDHTNGMNFPGTYMIDETTQQNEAQINNNISNNANLLFKSVSLKCKRIVKLDKHAFYESVVEQLLIYELSFYESQINLYNKGLDDITKEIICLTHFLNYKEGMKQINLLKARLYKTLSESIKHKNFTHEEQLKKYYFFINYKLKSKASQMKN